MSKIDYEITVDVRNLSVEEKKRVQDAFFKLGIVWASAGECHVHTYRTDLGFYTNADTDDAIGKNLMFAYHDEPVQPTHTPEQLYALAGMNDVPEGMEPFDLERALAGDPVVTRDGLEVSELHLFDYEHIGYCLYAYVHHKSGGFVNKYTREGQGFLDGEISPRDLFMLKQTHTVNGFEVPEPLREAPPISSTYYVPVLTYASFFSSTRAWGGCPADLMLLERGLVHATDTAATANAKAMIGIDPYEDAEND